jgi:DNA-binding LacI/PurR family transcriptional regulator
LAYDSGMAGKKVTLGDVARVAGVSVSTASEALSGGGRMTDTTRAKVRDSALRLGYRANALARGLRTGRTRAIGLHHLHAADTFASEYFRELVAGVMDVTRERDYDLTLLSSNPDRPRTSAPQVDGLIIADPIDDDQRATDLLATGLPTVAGERYPPGMAATPVIAIAHERGLRKVLDHCHAAGARRPLLVSPDNSGWGLLLRDTFQAWCAEHGLDGFHRASRFRNTPHHTHMTTVLTELEPAGVDALILPGEHSTLATLDVLAKLGLVPGRDILVAACADAQMLELCSPPVTAIGLRPRILGAECARTLLDHLDHGTDLPSLTLLEPELTFRASTEGRLRPTGRGPSSHVTRGHP